METSVNGFGEKKLLEWQKSTDDMCEKAQEFKKAQEKFMKGFYHFFPQKKDSFEEKTKGK